MNIGFLVFQHILGVLHLRQNPQPRFVAPLEGLPKTKHVGVQYSGELDLSAPTLRKYRFNPEYDL